MLVTLCWGFNWKIAVLSDITIDMTVVQNCKLHNSVKYDDCIACHYNTHGSINGVKVWRLPNYAPIMPIYALCPNVCRVHSFAHPINTNYSYTFVSEYSDYYRVPTEIVFFEKFCHRNYVGEYKHFLLYTWRRLYYSMTKHATMLLKIQWNDRVVILQSNIICY